mmetsp:Transcript_34634/g.84801  ORF Transcript_34634/g.84801 Transcript_34634/m.84801 type:complete len:214 (-) Transcript_34634:78-719(-)
MSASVTDHCASLVPTSKITDFAERLSASCLRGTPFAGLSSPYAKMTRIVPSITMSSSSHVCSARRKRIVVVSPSVTSLMSSYVDWSASTCGKPLALAWRSENTAVPSSSTQPITMSAPAMPPFGLKPTPTQPVLFTATSATSSPSATVHDSTNFDAASSASLNASGASLSDGFAASALATSCAHSAVQIVPTTSTTTNDMLHVLPPSISVGSR